MRLKCDCGSINIWWWRASQYSNSEAYCKDCKTGGMILDFKGDEI